MTGNTTERRRPLLGIGSCLAGNEVRYNGQSKSANVHVQALCETFETRAFCPEMGIGLGVPRPPIHLVGSESAVRVLDVDTHGNDYTQPLRDYAQTVLSLAPELSGYILVKGSPSCGFDRVKRFNERGNLVAYDQRGMFASALAELDPLLPLEDDGRLNDPSLRESFVTRVCAYHDWKQLSTQDLSPRDLVDFWTRYKYLVMAHHLPAYKALGRLVAGVGRADLVETSRQFIQTLMDALSHRASRRSHSNVLFHLAGYLKRDVDGSERQRLAALIEEYRQGLVPLVVPITMLKHHFANHPNAYIEQQAFLAPYPDHLRVRNLV